ncbi:D-alanyl-D-alanine carboxypeptidase/D-alanyl-D-alanine endopeptidase [Fontimonas thermophila]|uniref:D-alanyl-D-alanine carboxypeptidase/D-alanyl-D-alanine endopeptidase n=1 Tax=Fontimonas thermophila TaxID=1076937 RepID=UPI001F2983C0|nr:D-alanyl-D-alanine carboxypeptidase/D-alanyl-D-alanine-endopeptidase [Fontimonas thermophila]
MLAVLCAGAVIGAAAPAHAGWDALAALKARRGAHVTAAAVDLDTGQTLQTLDAQTRLSPASVSKLVLAAAALETWPIDKTFVTRVVGTGRLDEGDLQGDLVVYSEGDATLDHAALWVLAAQIKQSGIRSVAGDLVVSTAPFGRLGCETRDRCEALARSHTAYDAPLAAVGVDYGTWCVDVKPTQPGAAARIQSCAAVDVPIPLTGAIQTREVRRGTWLWLDRVKRSDGEALVMGGDIRADGAGARLYRSMADPALGAGLLLRQMLGELGVTLTGGVRIDDDAIPRGARPLAAIEGRPLRAQITDLLRYSNNYIADVLTLAMAAERTPEPVTTLARASEPLAELVLRARRQAGYADDGTRPRLLSGSGLTPENRLSAQDLVALLAYEYRQTQTFPVFYGGLVVPGQAPNAYLRAGSAAWKTRVALKTGTLSEPRTVFGMAGYLRKQNGGWIAFAALVNGATPRQAVPLHESLDAIRKDIEALLARH